MLLVLLMSLQGAYSYFNWGPCPNPTLQPNFNIVNYLGLWYDMAHVKDFIWEIGGECDVAQYSTSTTPGTIVVYNSEYKNNNWSSFKGSATCESSDPAHCSVTFFKEATPGDYRIVETDYTNYSVVFSCMGNGLGHDMWAWILARSQSFNYTSLIPTLLSFGFPQSEFAFTVQTGCPAPPTPPGYDEVIIYE
ncbi:hypothetical protein SteCoe_14192 [Stentor coeruleus]|uniref:Lipocalin/cytosolic fatty-acid binding domain-containing protein n=1 Tax=Stentor coeruleus TaxID=5963 RepID=A0A1R2C6Q5_9CILI|nr:hypothetical protein SteCoe_14192 [Stentor coeruleus]